MEEIYQRRDRIWIGGERSECSEKGWYDRDGCDASALICYFGGGSPLEDRDFVTEAEEGDGSHETGERTTDYHDMFG